MNATEFLTQNVVAIFALLVSCVTFYLTNRMNKKVNSKEYEMTENIKSELLRLIAVLRAIDAKACLVPHTKNEIDYTREIDEIAKIRTNPSFLYFLYSINNEEDRFWVQFNTNLLVVQANTMPTDSLRLFSNRMLKLLKKYVNFDAANEIDLKKLIPDFCEMKGIATFDENKTNKADLKFKQLIDKLVEIGNEDPDVKLFYGVLHGNEKIIDEALKNGANLKITDKELIKRYKKEYESLS